MRSDASAPIRSHACQSAFQLLVLASAFDLLCPFFPAISFPPPVRSTCIALPTCKHKKNERRHTVSPVIRVNIAKSISFDAPYTASCVRKGRVPLALEAFAPRSFCTHEAQSELDTSPGFIFRRRAFDRLGQRLRTRWGRGAEGGVAQDGLGGAPGRSRTI